MTLVDAATVLPWGSAVRAKATLALGLHYRAMAIANFANNDGALEGEGGEDGSDSGSRSAGPDTGGGGGGDDTSSTPARGAASTPAAPQRMLAAAISCLWEAVCGFRAACTTDFRLGGGESPDSSNPRWSSRAAAEVGPFDDRLASPRDVASAAHGPCLFVTSIGYVAARALAEALLDADRPVLGARMLGLCATTCRVGGGSDFREEASWGVVCVCVRGGEGRGGGGGGAMGGVCAKVTATTRARHLKHPTNPHTFPVRGWQERFLRRRLVVAALRARGNAFVGR